MDWKAAMGVDDDFAGIALTTFSLMPARMLAGGADVEAFEATLAKALLRRHPKVERNIDHLQDLGMRKARYRGRRRTRLQALFAATVANFKRSAVLGAFGSAAALAA